MGSRYAVPALNIPQPTDPLETVGKIYGVKHALQQSQIGDEQLTQQKLATQQAQQDQQDQQTVKQILGQTGGNLDQALPLLAGKVNPKTYESLQKYHLDTTKTALELNEKQRAQKLAQNSDLMGLITQAKALPPEQYAAQWPSIAAQAAKIKPELAQSINPQQPIPQEALGSFELGLMTTDQIYKAADEAAKAKKRPFEQTKVEADAKTAESDAQIKGSEAEAMQKFGGGLTAPAQKSKYLFLKAQQNKGMKLGPDDSSFVKAYEDEKTIGPRTTFNLQTTAGGGLTDTATDQAAEKYFQTGQLPSGGRGAAGLAQNRKIMNRAAELHPQGDLASNQAAFSANKESLKKLQTNFDQVTAFENTAGKNLDQFLTTAQKVVDAGSPLINRPLRAISKAMGGADMAAFDAARTTALTEISKVLNSSNASGVLSDSARHEVEGLIGRDATLKSIYAAAKILKTDMGNRHESYQAQISDIQSRLGSNKNGGGGKEIHYKIVNGQLVPQ
jgi:hypothetical protein